MRTPGKWSVDEYGNLCTDANTKIAFDFVPLNSPFVEGAFEKDYCDDEEYQEAIDNMNHIAHVVNTYDELLAAAEAIMKTLPLPMCEYEMYDTNNPMLPEKSRRIINLGKAIAKAKGE